MRLVIPILTALAVISSSAQAKEEKTMAQSQEALSRAGIQAVVRSSYCKFEFESFLAREKELERNNLIFPILYIPVPALAGDRWRLGPLLAIIGSANTRIGTICGNSIHLRPKFPTD